MDPETPRILTYANQPVNENVIVNLRPGGVTVRVLPSRRALRSAVGKLILGAVVGGLCLLVARGAALEGGEALVGEGIALVFAICALIAGGIAVVRAASPFELDADASGLTRTRWLALLGTDLGRQVMRWKRSQITDLVTTRLDRAWSMGPVYYLQLRLTDGRSESLGAGSKAEAQWLGNLLTSALAPSTIPGPATDVNPPAT